MLEDRRDRVSQLGLALTLADTLTPSQASTTTLVATRGSDVNASMAGQWFHTVTRSRTVAAGAFDAALFDAGAEPSDDTAGVTVVRSVLADRAGRVMVTSPSLRVQLTAELTPAELARVELVS